MGTLKELETLKFEATALRKLLQGKLPTFERKQHSAR